MFTSHGSYASGQAFVNGLVPAMWVGVGVLAVGAVIAALLPFDTRALAAQAAVEESAAAVSAVPLAA